MTNFDKLIQSLLVHEAFDRVLPIKNRYSRKGEEIERDLGNVDRERDAELRRKEYALNRTSMYQQPSMTARVHDRARTARGDLESELRSSRYDDNDEKIASLNDDPDETITSFKQRVRDRIMAQTLKRPGFDLNKQNLLELTSIQKLIKSIIEAYMVRQSLLGNLQGVPPIHQDIKSVAQKFESKSGLMVVNILPYFEFDYETATPTCRHGNGILDISFRPSKGDYSVLTGGGDATQIIATVMEIAFVTFCVIETGMKLCFPQFYKWRKTESANLIKFSGVGNYGNMNLNSKTAREGMNKRNRLYTLGWERAMKKRVPDLELVESSGSLIYIKYI